MATRNTTHGASMQKDAEALASAAKDTHSVSKRCSSVLGGLRKRKFRDEPLS